MKTQFNKLTAFIAALSFGVLTAGSALAADPISFQDGFEGPTLNPFWAIDRVQSGQIVFPSTNQAHSGLQSLQLSSFQTSADKWLILTHRFSRPQYGEVSIWVYDSAAGLSVGNYLVFRVGGSSHPNSDANIALWPDNPNGTAYYRYVRFDNTGGPSQIRRTRGWHQFRIRSTPDSVTFYVDGQLIHTDEGGGAFEYVSFDLQSPNYDPALTAYFDDFSFEAIPAPQLQVRVSQVELCWLTLSNSFYQVEYRDSLGTNGWVPFGSPIRGAGSRFCTNDFILPGQATRFYRASLIRNPSLP